MNKIPNRQAICEVLMEQAKEDKDIVRAKQSETIYKRMIEFCEMFKFPYIVIDTSKLSPEEVANRIIEEIK